MVDLLGISSLLIPTSKTFFQVFLVFCQSHLWFTLYKISAVFSVGTVHFSGIESIEEPEIKKISSSTNPKITSDFSEKQL